MHCSVSVSVPIWLSLIKIAFATPASMPRSRRSTLVQNRSSPTSCTRGPSASVSFAHPVQSSSASPSSIDTMGYRSIHPLYRATISSDVLRSEEHTSELQSLAYLVCRLLLEKKKKNQYIDY